MRFCLVLEWVLSCMIIWSITSRFILHLHLAYIFDLDISVLPGSYEWNIDTEGHPLSVIHNKMANWRVSQSMSAGELIDVGTQDVIIEILPNSHTRSCRRNDTEIWKITIYVFEKCRCWNIMNNPNTVLIDQDWLDCILICYADQKFINSIMIMLHAEMITGSSKRSSLNCVDV